MRKKREGDLVSAESVRNGKEELVGWARRGEGRMGRSGQEEKIKREGKGKSWAWLG